MPSPAPVRPRRRKGGTPELPTSGHDVTESVALAAGIAHEVNNPLSYVAAHIDTAVAEVRSLAGVSSAQGLAELEEILVQAQASHGRGEKQVMCQS